ncbi:MAG: N-acetyl-gamma-glutamyl-phosphate reductase, partial [Candidatus Dormibacteria bacterium]
AYLRPRDAVSVDAIADSYRAFSEENPFVVYADTPPATKTVTGTNLAVINCSEQDGVAVVTVAIDNLLKGAAGQGIQAMNVRFGFEEAAGLERQAQWP